MPIRPDPQLFDRLLAERESDTLEFKGGGWWDPDAVGRYASALANSARLAGQGSGALVWGVADDRTIQGTKLDTRTIVVKGQPLEFWLKGRLQPEGTGFAFHVGEKDGARLIALVVDAADRVPVKYEQTAYIRIGSATPALHDHPDKERALMEALTKTSFESDPAREYATADDVFDLLEVRGALELLGVVTNGAPTRSFMLNQLERRNLIAAVPGGRWTVSNVAAILFARDLAAFGREYERKVARIVFYAGNDRVRTNFEQKGTRGYAIGFEGMIGYLESNLPRSEELTGALRRETLTYPSLAIRELAANALIHQDLTVRGAGPMIEVFDGRIEITNPGAPLVAVDRLIDEPPRSRNEHIASLMRQIGVCEERGSGVDKVIASAEIFQLPPPDFAIKTEAFVATLYGPRDYGEMSPEERVRAAYQHACLHWVSGRGPITNATLRERFGLAPNRAAQISRLLGEALGYGAIKAADPTNQSRAHAAYVPYWA